MLDSKCTDGKPTVDALLPSVEVEHSDGTSSSNSGLMLFESEHTDDCVSLITTSSSWSGAWKLATGRVASLLLDDVTPFQS